MHFLEYFYYFNLLYNIKFYLQYVLQRTVYTLVILPTFKISAWQIPVAVYTVLGLLMMDSRSVQNV
jgi:hypothetical protein